LFQAADRPIVIAVGSDAQWKASARALGLDALADDVTLVTNVGRVTHRDRIVSQFSQRLATRPAAEWRDRLERAGVPTGVVQTVLEALRETNASPLTGLPSSVGGTVRFPPRS